MADITVTAANVQRASPAHRTFIKPYVAAATITVGQSVYLTTSGTVDLCDANAAGHEQFRGIALNAGGAGQAIDVLFEGEVNGFDLSGLAYGALVYQSDTAGALSTTASGTKTVVVGHVEAASDNAATKLLYVRAQQNNAW